MLLYSIRIQLTPGPEVARGRKILYSTYMYSIPYYTYGSTANLLFLGPTALIYISKERHCNEDLRSVGNLLIELVIR